MTSNNSSRSVLPRRTFLKSTAAIAAGTLAAGMLLPRTALAVSPALTFADIPGTGDVKVLNYALALEYLEADLYLQALQRLTTGGKNKLGQTITGLGVSSSSIDVAYINEFGKVERQHRDFLVSFLGSSAIPSFKYDFSMNTLSRKKVVELIYTAEKTGVSAYLGAIPFLETRKYLRTAGAIQGTEARHTAVISAVLANLFSEDLGVAPLATQNGGRDVPLAPDTVLAAVSPFIVT